MKYYGITYGDAKFATSRKWAVESMKPHFDEVRLFTEKDLSPYRERFPNIIYDGARGGGWWIFKPLFLQLVMHEDMKSGDMVAWIDAGIKCKSNFKKYLSTFYDIAQNNLGFWLSQCIHSHSEWTKRDCFVYMGCDEEKFHNARQCDASSQMYIKNQTTMTFIAEYLTCCANTNIVTDQPNTCKLPNFTHFKEHRHDQSILTNLSIRYNLNRFMEASQWRKNWTVGLQKKWMTQYEIEQSTRYPSVLQQHRTEDYSNDW